jgi:hypothetical protein
MRRSGTTPDDYLATLPADLRATMNELDDWISRVFAGRGRSLWEGVFWGGTEQSIIGYGDIVQPRPRGDDVEWFAVGLARQKDHFSLYVNAAEDGAYLLASYKSRLGKARVGSASIAFTDVAKLDRDVLDELLVRAEALTRD